MKAIFCKLCNHHHHPRDPHIWGQDELIAHSVEKDHRRAKPDSVPQPKALPRPIDLTDDELVPYYNELSRRKMKAARAADKEKKNA